MVISLYQISSFKYVNNNCLNTILFIPGWGCNLNYMIPFKNIIKHANLLFIDLPGFKNNEPFKHPYTIEEIADIIYIFIKEHHYHINFIVGHSFGGKLAIILANKLNNIQSLFLFAPSIYHKRRTLIYYLKIYLYKLLKKIHCRPFILNRFGSKDYKELSNVLKKTMSNVINTNVDHYLLAYKNPIILFFGNKDKITPIYLAKKIKKKAFDCFLIRLNGNHFAYLTNINMVANTIERVIIKYYGK